MQNVFKEKVGLHCRAGDLIKVLGYSNPSKAVFMNVDKDDKTELPIWDGRHNRNMKIISESGLHWFRYN